MTIWTKHVAWLAALVVLTACATGATKEDFDRVTAGMRRADVDKALENLGQGEPAVADDVLSTFGGMDTAQLDALAKLTLVKWGTTKQPLFVGFDPREGTAKWKVVYTPSFKSITWVR